MTNLSETVLGKIKKEQISPVPRWLFLFKNYAFWSLLFLSMLLGSMSFSVIIHIAGSGDFDILNHLRGSILTSGFMLLPLFWLISLVLFALVAYFNWKHTRHAYRFKRRWIFLSGFFSSLLFGYIFYVSGLGKFIDLLMVRSVQYYGNSKHKARVELWQQPESGLLIGRIVDVKEGEEELIVEDGKGNDWVIENKVSTQRKEGVRQVIKKGTIVKIVGSNKGSQKIEARDIRDCKDCDGDDDDYGGQDTDNDGDGK